eukprot:COSAG06_NODE_446_length_15654_cov_8.176278_12_plen_62_part_00
MKGERGGGRQTHERVEPVVRVGIDRLDELLQIINWIAFAICHARVCIVQELHQLGPDLTLE